MTEIDLPRSAAGTVPERVIWSPYVMVLVGARPIATAVAAPPQRRRIEQTRVLN
jgi:hypothetical protein